MFSVQLMNVFSPQMKTKVQASTAPPSDTESDAPPTHPATQPSDPDSSLRSSCSRADAGSDTTRTDLLSMQRELLSKLDQSAQKSPIDRQKDTFAEFMKEVTYTFPPPMWLRFQGEVQALLQKYQLENMEPMVPPHEPAISAPMHQPMQSQFPGPSNPMASSSGWQPRPSHWPDPGHFLRPTSVWGSQEASWVHAQQQHQQQQQPPQQMLQQQQSLSQQRPIRPQSAPTTYTSITSTPQHSPAPSPQVGGNFTTLSSVLCAAMGDVSFTPIPMNIQDDGQLPADELPDLDKDK